MVLPWDVVSTTDSVAVVSTSLLFGSFSGVRVIVLGCCGSDRYVLFMGADELTTDLPFFGHASAVVKSLPLSIIVADKRRNSE